MGRVVGSLSVVTCIDGDAESAMLASWVTQASFDPPGLTVAVKKDRAAESLLVRGLLFSQRPVRLPTPLSASTRQVPVRGVAKMQVNGNAFNLNILKEGADGPVVKALLKPFGPGEDRFGAVEHHRSETSGCVVLDAAASVLECTVSSRMDAGDHYIVYGTVQAGKVVDPKAVSAVHHRKSGDSY